MKPKYREMIRKRRPIAQKMAERVKNYDFAIDPLPPPMIYISFDVSK